MDYVHVIESTPLDDYRPGRTPWLDPDGSCGTYTAPEGFHPDIFRLRIPRAQLATWWSARLTAFQSWPYVTVGPRETPGLAEWCLAQGYTLYERDYLMVAAPGCVTPSDPDPRVQEVTTVQGLASVFALDHLVFNDPIPNQDAVAASLAEIRRGHFRLFVVPDATGSALAAGGLSVKGTWAMMWGGETHPDHRRQGLYRALVTRRLDEAWRAGARFVATNANQETSAPVLERMGFQIIESFVILKPPQASANTVEP